MRSRTLLNADALFELTVGLALLMNGLLGPRFPFGAPIAALLGVAFLVSSVALGQGGMGKGPLVNRLGLVGLVNSLSAIVLCLAAILWLDGGARTAVLVVCVTACALGVTQMVANHRGPTNPSGVPRATAEELRMAIGHTPTTRRDDP